MGPTRVVSLAVLLAVYTLCSEANPVVTSGDTLTDNTDTNTFTTTTTTTTSNTKDNTTADGNRTQQNSTLDKFELNTSHSPNNTKNDNTSTDATTTELPPVPRCKYEFKAGVRNNLFFNGQQELLPLLIKKFVIHKNQPRCYVTREDFERQLDTGRQSEAIVVLALACLDAANTHVVTRQEAEELAGGGDRGWSTQAQYATDQDHVTTTTSTTTTGHAHSATEGPEGSESGNMTGGGGRYYHNYITNTTTGQTEGPEGSESGNMTGGGGRYYHNYISYLQSMHCRLSLRVVELVAAMTELRVLTVMGERAWDLAQLQHHPTLCHVFSKVKALSVMSDWSAPGYLHHLTRCAGRLDSVVEMVLSNDSLPAFPAVLRPVLPNLRALDLINNRLASPVTFPWPDGFAELPRNLSRTFQFNDLYDFRGSFDMPRHLFRRLLLLDGNNITSLTAFQFTSHFQHISLQRNGLREIGEDVFDLVPDLQFLSLAHNLLTSLPARLLARLTALRKLDLQGNRLAALPDTIFHSVLRLEKLNLDNNRLQVLQDGLFSRLEELQELKLKNNSVRRLAHGALSMMMVKLRLLELQHNPLPAFPVIVLELRGLVHTHLEYTAIETLDFVAISRTTTLSRLAEGLKNPTTGEFADLQQTPATQRLIYLRYSRLRSVVVFNATRDTLPIFMLIIKHFTILMEGSKLACDCHILNVTHQLQAWRAEGKLTGAEACLEGWNCAWPAELSGKRVAGLKDEQTYCPVQEEGEGGGAGGSGSASCPEGCACYVRTKVETVIVDCKHAGLTSLPPRVPANTRELWVQNNSIKTVGRLPYMQHLYSLKLTANNLQELPPEVVSFMPQLRELHVDDNWLTSLSRDLGSLRHLTSVRLAGNPFRCDCHTLWLKDWLLTHQVEAEDWATIKCSTEEADGRVLTLVPEAEFVCKTSASLGQLAAPIAVPVTLALLVLVAAVLVFLQRRHLKVLLYIHTGLHPFDTDPPDHQARYDVSVCCDVTACAWVLRHVVEALEEGGRYRVFFYPRDAFLGFTTSENVRHCVRHSRRLVVVLGKGWEDSELMVTASREGLARCQRDLVHFMTLVLHHFSAKDIANKHLQHYTQRGRYVSTEDKHFRQRLLYEMPHVRTPRARQPAKRRVKGGEKAEREAGRRQEEKAEREAGRRQEEKDGARQQDPQPPVALYDIVAAAENEQNDLAERRASYRHSQGHRDKAGDGAVFSQHSTAFLPHSASNTQLSLSDLRLNLDTTQRRSTGSLDTLSAEHLDTTQRRSTGSLDTLSAEHLDTTQRRSTGNLDTLSAQHLDTTQRRSTGSLDTLSAQHLAPSAIVRQTSLQPSVLSEDLFGEGVGERMSRHKDQADSRQCRGSEADPQLAVSNPACDGQLGVASDSGRQPRSVLVWCSQQDLQFALHAVVRPLERAGHRCVLEERDFPLGAAIQENIVQAAHSCTRTLLVLSPHTLQHEWFTFVFHVTFDRQIESREHRVTLVTREGLDVSKFVEEIQQALKTSALLRENDPWFAKRLKQFIDFDGYEIC